MTYSDDRSAAGLVALCRAKEGHDLPRRSPFVIALTAAEWRELEARAQRYASPYRDVVRAKIVLLAASDVGNDEIGTVGYAPPEREHMAPSLLSRPGQRGQARGEPGRKGSSGPHHTSRGAILN
jgi:hypothetical protein